LSVGGDAKGPNAFRTIAEVAAMLDVAPHVLRFWEGKFTQLRPMTRAGGRRLYRPEDVALLRGIQALLAEDGYSIKGVQKLLREQGVAHVRGRGQSGRVEIDEGAPAREPASSAAAAPAPTTAAASGVDHGPLFENARPSASAGVTLRRALVRLEQARAALERIAPAR
jgi:DNA-binding transcriptional MerR regulator